MSLVTCLVCKCPDGWREYTRGDQQTHCYKYFEDLKRWTEARAQCQTYHNLGGCTGGADLASIDADALNRLVFINFDIDVNCILFSQFSLMQGVN